MPANGGRRRNDRRCGRVWHGLTARERDVMERVVARKRNRAIAFELGVGIKTVEVHRARAMEKMIAESLPELTAPCILCGRYTGKP